MYLLPSFSIISSLTVVALYAVSLFSTSSLVEITVTSDLVSYFLTVLITVSGTSVSSALISFPSASTYLTIALPFVSIVSFNASGYSFKS